MGNSSTEKPVLVLDGERASALAIVRSLGRRGLQVEVGSSETQPLAALSRYCIDRFTYADPFDDPSGFQKTILEKLEDRQYSLVIPVTDLTICPLMGIRGLAKVRTPLAMASNEALSVTLSKSRTCDLARSLGVPVPKTVVIRDENEFYKMQDKHPYPVVVKPDRSKNWSLNGKCDDISVVYALNPEELNDSVSQLLKFGPVLLQEYIRGEGVGMGLLAAHGETLFAFQYRRLHEVPLTGGASSYRVSEAIDPELLGYASSLLKGLCWDGVAMIEFKTDREGRRTYLMEVNGRFWGSLPLAVAAGADFPCYLFDLIVHKRHDFPAIYKVGVRCRELARELEWLAEVVFQRRRAHPVVRLPSYQRVLMDSCRVLNPLERCDTIDLWDRRPGMSELGKIIRYIVERGWSKLWYLRAKHRMRRVQRNPRLLLNRVRRAMTILIVCHGNIIRSPFAAQILSKSIKDESSVSVCSAGLEAVAGLRAHPNAISKAKSLGFDLSSHVSCALTPGIVAKADLIFAMEITHLVLIRRRFPGAWRKTFLLGCLNPQICLEIPDPVGRDEATFDTCFSQILTALKPMVAFLSEGIQVGGK